MTEATRQTAQDAPPGMIAAFKALSPRFLPFADAASETLPLGRLLRLSLFQVSVGMAAVLLSGTLNRVMIVELGVPASMVALMIALPLVSAPLRALIGFRSDTHKSFIGWRRTPYLWFGTMLQFGGFAIMPFALFLLAGDQTVGPAWAGQVGAGLAFLLVGIGMHVTQTAGLALATDMAREEDRPRVVALLYVTLLLGMAVSALVFGALLDAFSHLRLIQTVQGAAAVTLALNLIALWKQEVRRPDITAPDKPRPSFGDAWRAMCRGTDAGRMLVAVGLGAAGFAMQDVLLEPYGGEILGLGVGQTTLLTALSAGGALLGFAAAAAALKRGIEPLRTAALGALTGIPAFSCVIFAAPLGSAVLFQIGALLIGLGGGLFSVGALTAAMGLAAQGGDEPDVDAGADAWRSGLALGAWGAVHATAAGAAILAGGALRDGVTGLALSGAFGPAAANPALGYSVVYHFEILLLFATLVALGPLAKFAPTQPQDASPKKFGLAEFPN